MIVLDANVLLYAYDAADPRQPRAAAWLEDAFGGSAEIGLPLTSILAFVRIASDPRVYDTPREPEDAIGLVETWLSRPNVDLIGPTDGHWKTLAGLAAAGKARGSLVMDAHLAALALEHGATLATTDRDFARFPGLRTVDPTRD